MGIFGNMKMYGGAGRNSLTVTITPELKNKQLFLNVVDAKTTALVIVQIVNKGFCGKVNGTR